MLKQFRILSALMVLGMGSLCAGNHPGAGQWEISADFLYLLPTVDDTYFVIDSASGSTNPNGKRENNDFDFHPGFRIGAAYGLCDCNREFEVQYSWLEAKQNRTVAGDSLWATLGESNFLTSAFAAYSGTAESHLNLLYQRVDANISQEVLNCCGLDLRLQLGLEYAFLRLHEDYRYVNTNAQNAQIKQESKAWGIGPQLGFAIDYDIMNECGCMPGSLSFVASSSGSILASKSKTRNFQEGTANGFILGVNDEDTWRLIPAFHANLGLNYNLCFSCYEANLEIGYEFNTYFRGLTRTAFPDDVARGLCLTEYYNFDVQGLYVSASIRF